MVLLGNRKHNRIPIKEEVKKMKKTINGRTIKVQIFNDEIFVEMISALGQLLGTIVMPQKMEEGLIKTYLESRTVETTYLYINGKEITDNKNYNPFKMQETEKAIK